MKPLLVLGVALMLSFSLLGCEDTENTTGAQPVASVPDQLQDVTVRQLYEEAVANLARYDDMYKGKWFLVTGTVSHLFDYQVVVNPVSRRGEEHAVLTDLPHSDQIPLDSGDAIAARCQVGEVVGYGVYMENCSLETVTLPTPSEFGPTLTSTESAALPTATEASTPEPTASAN